jgi:hypothetical protein
MLNLVQIVLIGPVSNMKYDGRFYTQYFLCTALQSGRLAWRLYINLKYKVKAKIIETKLVSSLKNFLMAPEQAKNQMVKKWYLQ